jgi:menaquinol-cytochrome c reductase iron-sulfur subunit
MPKTVLETEVSQADCRCGSAPDPAKAAGVTRRGFYHTAICAMGSAMGAALALPAVVYLFASPRTRRQSQWVEVADITALPQNEPSEVSFQRSHVDGWKISTEKSTAWVVKDANAQVVAFAPQCTHLGCAYHWEGAQNVFVCPCHASTFSKDGKVLGGPAPRPLDRYLTRLEGNKLMVGPLAGNGEV